MEGSENK